MRRGIMLGLAGTLAAHSGAAAQFAADRTGPPAQAPAAQPVQPAPPQPAPPPPVQAVQQAGYLAAAPVAPTHPQPPAPTDHPLGVRPDHGAYLICVKSYVGPDARALAEELAAHIHKAHNAAAYLFERSADKRREDAAEKARARRQFEHQNALFLQNQVDLQKKLKAEAEAAGREFIPTPVKVRVPAVKTEFPEQWAVLVGGFPTEDGARRALDVVRRWPAPAGEHLLDRVVAQAGDRGGAGGTFVNPFAAAMVFPNPAAARPAGAKAPPADPALGKLNEEEPLSLLRCPKTHTLVVKTFSVPTRVQTKAEQGGALARLFAGDGDAAKHLDATAKQAREFAQALRTESAAETANKEAARLGLTPPGGLDAYVLHTRTGSIVTVGGFDDPEQFPSALAEVNNMGTLLAAMKYQLQARKDGPVIEEKPMFERVHLIRVPRAQ